MVFIPCLENVVALNFTENTNIYFLTLKTNFMKKLFCFLASAFLAIPAFAQSPLWAIKSGTLGKTYQYCNSIAVDGAGYIYRTGEFGSSDSILFGSHKLRNYSPGLSVYKFIAKYAPNGDIIWAKQIDYGGAIALNVDVVGNIYLNADQCGVSDLYKFDSSGNLLWQSTFTQAYAHSRVVTDPWGYAYYISSFSSPSLTVGGYTLTNTGTTYDMYIVKYTPSGSIVWAKNCGVPSNELISTASADREGNLLIAGLFNPNFSLKKFDTSGTLVWELPWLYTSSTIDNDIFCIKTDKQNNIFITGSMKGTTANFNGVSISNDPGNTCGFVVKLNQAGEGQWSKKLSVKSGRAGGYSVALDTAGFAWVSGGYFGDTLKIDSVALAPPLHLADTAMCYPKPMFIAKFDKNGKVKYTMSAVSGGGTAIGSVQGEGNGLAADNFGNVYFTTDYCYYPYTFGGLAIPAAPYSNALLAKFGPKANTGLPEMEHTQSLSVYPNPAENEFSISYQGNPDPNGYALLCDMFGKVITKTQLTSCNTRISTQNLAAGTYRCIVVLNGQKIGKSLVVVH